MAINQRKDHFSLVCTEQKLQKLHFNPTKNVSENIEMVDSCNDFTNNYLTVTLKFANYVNWDIHYVPSLCCSLKKL